MSYHYTPSPELQLVTACCRWPDDAARHEAIAHALAAASSHAFDWEQMLKVVDRHRVAGLVQQGLSRYQKQLPSPIAEQLNRRAITQLQSSLWLASESRQLIAKLQQAGVRAMIMKGAPLARLAYGNLALRHSKDCDIAIEPEDRKLAVAVVEAAGYRRRLPSARYSFEQLTPFLDSLKDFEYVHPQTGAQMELQWRMTRSPHQWDHPWQIEQAQWVEISPGIKLPTLPESYHLLYLCLHASVHTWFRLKWLADIQAMLAQQGPQASTRLLAQAREQGLERVVSATLTLSSLLFGTPATAQQQPPDWAERWLVRQALKTITAGGGAVEPEDMRFGTTQLAMTQYLLRSDWRYLRDQLLIDLAGMEPDSPMEPVWKQALLRGPRWGWRRIRYAGRKRAQS